MDKNKYKELIHRFYKEQYGDDEADNPIVTDYENINDYMKSKIEKRKHIPQLHNPNFNVMEFNNIRNEAGTNGFILSSSKWIEKTKAIGIKSSAGRYGGTYAHKDIAIVQMQSLLDNKSVKKLL